MSVCRVLTSYGTHQDLRVADVRRRQESLSAETKPSPAASKNEKAAPAPDGAKKPARTLYATQRKKPAPSAARAARGDRPDGTRPGRGPVTATHLRAYATVLDRRCRRMPETERTKKEK